MSVETISRSTGRVYRVRQRDYAGHTLSETYPTEGHAQARDAEIKLAKAKREPIPKRGRGDASESFEAFTENVWWAQHVKGRLTTKTQEGYAAMLDKHLMPRIGSEPVAHIDVDQVLEVRASLAADGVPDYTSARVLKLLRQILGHAVLTGRLPYNPADILRGRGQLPPQRRTTDIRPLWPDETEAIRRAMLARKTPNALRDATIVSVMAYAGLRPGEALALTWEHIGPDWIRVERRVSAGKILPDAKAGHRRTVPNLIAPLMADLADWREKAQPKAKALVFGGVQGRPWSPEAYKSWSARTFKTCAPDGSTPYSLRHGYASLLVREGVDMAEIAARMGHSVAMTTDHYTHVFSAYRGKPRESMAAVVALARTQPRHTARATRGSRKRKRPPKMAPLLAFRP